MDFELDTIGDDFYYAPLNGMVVVEVVEPSDDAGVVLRRGDEQSSLIAGYLTQPLVMDVRHGTGTQTLRIDPTDLVFFRSEETYPDRFWILGREYCVIDPTVLVTMIRGNVDENTSDYGGVIYD